MEQTQKLNNKMLSKLCKENNPEACMDCTSIKCNCTCHKQIETNLKKIKKLKEDKEYYKNLYEYNNEY